MKIPPKHKDQKCIFAKKNSIVCILLVNVSMYINSIEEPIIPNVNNCT